MAADRAAGCGNDRTDTGAKMAVWDRRRGYWLSGCAGMALIALSGCGEGALPGFLQAKPDTAETAPTRTEAGPATKPQVERDVEAPEVFQTTDAGLWDGRPSLGGVWVAHPDVEDPERVIIRNEDNGEFVVGALFRRERETPGPTIQVSSDAAEALGMLAGAPATLEVTALRRKEVPAESEDPPATGGDTAAPGTPEAIEATPLDAPDTAIDAAAAIDRAEAEAAAEPASPLDKPFIQIGIFSVEENANNTATSLRNIGILPTIRKEPIEGKTFWRVVIGPATSAGERATLLGKVKELGFTDAYFVAN